MGRKGLDDLSGPQFALSTPAAHHTSVDDRPTPVYGSQYAALAANRDKRRAPNTRYGDPTNVFALAWANLTHHKLRSALSVLAVALGITLLLVSNGLASGSIAEVDQRMQSVDAELVVLPAQENIIFTGGAPFPGIYQRYIAKQKDQRGPLATDVIPVFFSQVRMGGQQQRVFGVDPRHMDAFLGPRRLIAGKLFDNAHQFAKFSDQRNAPQDVPTLIPDLTDDQWHDGLEIVIDNRLRQVGFTDPNTGENRPYQLGDEVLLAGRTFRIVGIIETGVAGRVFAPLQTLRELLNGGEPWSSMFFIKIRTDIDPRAAANHFQKTLGETARVELKSTYGALLRDSFAQVNMYMSATSGLALVVCFLFILLTMYTMVLERTREIGILKSIGLTRLGVMCLSITEALVVSLSGVLVGIAFAFAAKWALTIAMPLLTVALSPERLITAIAIGVIGGICSALYPGYRAAKLDPALALNYE